MEQYIIFKAFKKADWATDAEGWDWVSEAVRAEARGWGRQSTTAHSADWPDWVHV